MTAIRGWGRSFPLAENLITDSNNRGLTERQRVRIIKKQKERRDKRLALSTNYEMTAIRTRGRSFPLAENLITDSNNADDHESKLEQLPVCNHKHSPFPGEKVPPVMGD